MEEVDRGLAPALAVQFGHRRQALNAGAFHVGWRLGVGEAERIGGSIALGHLTSATLLATGEGFRSGGATALRADAEVFVEIGRELRPDAAAAEVRRAIVAYGGALELVDLGNAGDGPEAVIAGNTFHRAVRFGPSRPQLPAEALEVRVLVNGEFCAAAPAPDDCAGRLAAAARLLDAVQERFRPGDRVITGAVVQVGVTDGDDVVADFGALGRVQIAIT